MKKVLFFHVARTSGTSLEDFFRKLLGDFFIQAQHPSQLVDPLLGRVRDLGDIRRILDAHAGLSLHYDSNFDEVRTSDDFGMQVWYLFEPQHVRYFEQFTILTMLREPFRRFLSDYAWVRQKQRENPGFLPDVDASSVERYLEQSHENLVLHYLLESRTSTKRRFSRDDLERVKERIVGYPIHVGIFERYAESVAWFAQVLGRDFSASDVAHLNAGAEPPPADAALEARFRARHALDVELYEFAARLLDERLRASSA